MGPNRQAARLLEEFIDAWDPNNKEGQYYEEALSREAIRDKRRVYHHHRATYDMKCTHMSTTRPAPRRPDQLDDPIPKPNEVDEFLEELLTKFRAS